MRIRIASRPTLRILVGIIAALALAHVLVTVAWLSLGHDYQLGLRREFDLDLEQNVPSYFSALQLLASALLLAVLAARARGGRDPRNARAWGILAAVFAFLSLDEAASFHELWNQLGPAFHFTSGVLHYAWVLPCGLLTVVFALLCLPFLLRLPRSISVRMVTAGALFVSGAVGMELLENALLHGGRAEGTYLMKGLVLIEETLEMLGIAYFIATLLRYVELSGAPLELEVRAGADGDQRTPRGDAAAAVVDPYRGTTVTTMRR